MFSLPMSELTNRDHEARAVLGIRIQELEQRLGESKSFEERVQIADTYLLRHCLTLPKLAGVSAAAMTILHCRGDIEIPTLAHRAGVSTRQFERRFKREVGVSPKLRQNCTIRSSSREQGAINFRFMDRCRSSPRILRPDALDPRFQGVLGRHTDKFAHSIGNKL
jgi:AraC-like DNA-binding protein